MKELIFKNQTFTRTIILLLAFVACSGIAFSWTGPSSNPPSGNVAAPVNVGSVSQIKSAGLGVASLGVSGGQYILGNLSIGSTSASQKLDVSGNVRATAFLYSSDASQKSDIQTISNASDIIKQLRGVSFVWKENNRPSIGLIAQEVEKVVPQVVHTDPKTGLKSVEYANLIAPLIETVKEQQAQIDSLEEQVKELRSIIEKK